MKNPNKEIFCLKKELLEEFCNKIVEISNKIQKCYAVNQKEFCEIIGIEDGSYRFLKKGRMKRGPERINIIFYYLIYMLDDEEHQTEDFYYFFEKDYHHKIEEILTTSDWMERKKNILNKLKKGDSYNESEEKKYDVDRQLETRVPPIVRNIIEFLKKHVVCNIDIILSAMKYKKYFKCECIYAPDSELDLTVLIPKIKYIMVITYLQPDEEIRIMKENDDMDLFILIHNKKCQISEYQFFDEGEKSQKIEDKLILECVDGKSKQLYILNDSEEFCLGNFFNSEIKIKKSENITNSELEKNN